jgi:hypothetical protein
MQLVSRETLFLLDVGGWETKNAGISFERTRFDVSRETFRRGLPIGPPPQPGGLLCAHARAAISVSRETIIRPGPSGHPQIFSRETFPEGPAALDRCQARWDVPRFWQAWLQRSFVNPDRPERLFHVKHGLLCRPAQPSWLCHESHWLASGGPWPTTAAVAAIV